MTLNASECLLALAISSIGFVFNPVEAQAGCDPAPSVDWVSVVDRNAPTADEHIWLIHSFSTAVQVRLDGNPLKPVEETSRYTRYEPPTTEPAAHKLHIEVFSKYDPGVLVQTLEHEYTTVQSVLQQEEVVYLKQWVEDDSFQHSASICGRMTYEQQCYDTYRPSFTTAQLDGEAFAYKVEKQNKFGDWYELDVIWPGPCVPAVEVEDLLADDDVTSFQDVRIIALNARGERYTVSEQPPEHSEEVENPLCQSIPAGDTPTQPSGLWLLGALLIGFKRRSAQKHSSSSLPHSLP